NRWDSIVRTAEIFPYFKNELEGLLKAVGFKKMDFYRNFNFEDYDKNGTDLIVVCEKKGTLKGKLPTKNLASSERVMKTPKTVSTKGQARPAKPGARVSVQGHHGAPPKKLRQTLGKSRKSQGKKTR